MSSKRRHAGEVQESRGQGSHQKRFKGVQSHVCNNEKMHPRSKHHEAPDYFVLADKYPDFKPFVYRNRFGSASIDYKDAAALRALSRCLLKEYYGLEWSLPESFLCPPVPTRANYIHEVADLLAVKEAGGGAEQKGGAGETTRVDQEEKDDEDERKKNLIPPRGPQICGLDVGVGANCIYALLGAASYGWTFVGSDISSDAIGAAQKNVDANGLGERIRLRLQKDRTKIFEGVLTPGDTFAFSMCNPPFHESLESAGVNPARVLEGQDGELACEGGESGFIRRMIRESFSYCQQIIWFTSLVARLSTLKSLRQLLGSPESLRELLREGAETQGGGQVEGLEERLPSVKETRVVTLHQGKQTRWVIAWTFMDSFKREAILGSLGSSSSSSVSEEKEEKGESKDEEDSSACVQQDREGETKQNPSDSNSEPA
uniref:U6 small nuclear RNA (adenine-(43)-N(6))-methyltransferase n=1 Tax=Chromera velia CCMP2878 TaxID=1169474 RepID=A0A0G4GCE4_9ALVE|mmetsp:Transcript_36497/g.71782  ORF Transcript_36497/g.71782 Transcript_36497/m.71782 type:complete len:430 (-) Transcript_36497:154-1443(-)|eukprot:Cvel_21275.t1-p1 / transcript=Cvel_21275.t1 / gene=Cvel_21275 / organism=Chromera_velia_CCMP2878 / gene_product=Ribosomal RNA large subunit methyltransferase F, putative / transcript_product=Ribosomal RNA large subunit methyltransferase F, putative / location=Cvel_scaffold1980:24704-30076(-) / protein_length=429 / sequence_SO=supercontig / SO=protein_coding / is_pseudo=false